jgi:hypothetical protein
LGILPRLAANPWRRRFYKGFYPRRRVDKFFCSIKKHHRAATRYDKLATSNGT